MQCRWRNSVQGWKLEICSLTHCVINNTNSWKFCTVMLKYEYTLCQANWMSQSIFFTVLWVIYLVILLVHDAHWSGHEMWNLNCEIPWGFSAFFVVGLPTYLHKGMPDVNVFHSWFKLIASRTICVCAFVKYSIWQRNHFSFLMLHIYGIKQCCKCTKITHCVELKKIIFSSFFILASLHKLTLR